MRLNCVAAKALAIVGAMLVPASYARAGFLATDANAIPGWHSTQNFQASVVVRSFNADVDYAVYAPGAFNSSFPAQDPSGDTQYVYAYQINNVGGGTNPQAISFMSLGFNSDVSPSNFMSIGVPAPANTGTPTNGSYITAVNWDYTTNIIPVSSSSAILLYTSPNGPDIASASVSGAGVGGSQHTLPSPIPEPAVGLTIFGLLAAGMSRRPRVA